MESIIKTREGTEMHGAGQEKSLHFFYETVPGRCVLKLANRRMTARIVGAYMNSPLSRGMINRFIRKNDMDMSVYEDKKYKCYNEFFTRRMKSECIDIDFDEKDLVSPCDSKLTAYPINKNTVFYIKNAPYNVRELLKNDRLAEKFSGGYCLVFRLTVDDYHRYCYFDDGEKGENVFIKGILHTVNPISLDNHYNYYKQNCREYTVIKTKNFGEAVQMEVGAMLIGRIKNHHDACTVRRGEEKGMFEFGGSTVVVLLRKNEAIIDGDIMANSEKGIETVVRMGEKIGVSAK